MDSNCLACHTEIDAMRKAKRGYHARVTDRTCASCHPDHAGREFDLVSWGEGGRAAFEHRRAGSATFTAPRSARNATPATAWMDGSRRGASITTTPAIH
jgi:hypothetical protein